MRCFKILISNNKLRDKFTYLIVILTNAQNALQLPRNNKDSAKNVPEHFGMIWRHSFVIDCRKSSSETGVESILLFKCYYRKKSKEV